MTPALKSDPLLQSFALRHLRLRNRIVSTAHAPAYVEDGHPRDRYRLYHEEKARGGLGLTIIGGSTNIAPDSPSVFGQLYAGDDSIIPWFQRLTDGVRAQGAGVMCQITHMGRRTAWDDGHWLPVAGPSGIRERAHRAFPKTMEAEDIQRIITQFANAARRVQQGGFDGVELLSHSHLLGQFLSPLVNQRTDAYGGSLENRLRLTLQVLEAVRDAVGPEMIVSMRITGDELVEGGLSAEDCVWVARTLADTGAVDLFNVLAGAPYDDLGLAGWVPPMGMPAGAHLSVAAQIRKAVRIPILHAGGVADLATAREAVSQGWVDLIGMTRAHIADPHLVRKVTDGEEHRIRPCVGLGYCVDRVNQGKDALCGHNPATGREASIPHQFKPSETTLNQPGRVVVVVGGGPGGMEAARVCAGRGHRVVLFEASNRLGGQLNLAAQGTTRRQIKGVSDWLAAEIEHLGVNVRLNTFAQAADIEAESPDLVVIATGGWPDTAPQPGGDHALSSWDVLGGEARPSGEVLLVDECGDQAAAVCAQVMAQHGAQVTLVTPDRALAHDLGPTNSAVVLRDLAQAGVGFECLQELASITPQGNRKRVVLRHVLTGIETERVVDAVVMETGSAPMDAIYHDLRPASRNLGQLDHSAMISGRSPLAAEANPDGRFLLARIGDAVASRNIHAALYDALRVCKDF